MLEQTMHELEQGLDFMMAESESEAGKTGRKSHSRQSLDSSTTNLV